MLLLSLSSDGTLLLLVLVLMLVIYHMSLRHLDIPSSKSWRNHPDIRNSLRLTLRIKRDHIAGPFVTAGCFYELSVDCGLSHVQIPTEKAHPLSRFGCCCYYYSYLYLSQLILFSFDLSIFNGCLSLVPKVKVN